MNTHSNSYNSNNYNNSSIDFSDPPSTNSLLSGYYSDKEISSSYTLTNSNNNNNNIPFPSPPPPQRRREEQGEESMEDEDITVNNSTIEDCSSPVSTSISYSSFADHWNRSVDVSFA